MKKSIELPVAFTPDGEICEGNAQHGVQAVEIITVAWNRKWLVVAYAW